VEFEFAEHGIGERNFGVRASGGELDELFGVLDGEVAEEEGVDEGEDGGVGADAESEREDGDGSEGGGFGEGAEGVAEGWEKGGDGGASEIQNALLGIRRERR
jgi:hypothetical protein